MSGGLLVTAPLTNRVDSTIRIPYGVENLERAHSERPNARRGAWFIELEGSVS